jgi:succinoglycan biosynthesis transport protein ExoP
MENDRLSKILSVLHTLHMITTTKKSTLDTDAINSPQEQFKEPLKEQNPDQSLESIVPEISKSGLSEKLDVLHNPASFISEQFKTLKVRLHECSSKHQVKVITVSSPYTSDGKSLICVNLGLCFARDPNRRVLLIDCDLRNPTIHRYLKISLSPGLNGYLSEKHMPPHCFMRRLGRLYVMTAGGASTDPIELLSQDTMRKLIEVLKKDFDTILIDTPPLGLVSDAKIMTEMSDGLLMVVRSNKTTYTNIERSFKLLDQSKLLGIVLNDVQAHMFNTQYDYRYYHYSNRNVYPYGPKMKNKFKSKTYFE